MDNINNCLGKLLLLIMVLMLTPGTASADKKYRSFVDYPGFAEYYKNRCVQEAPPPEGNDRELLARFMPRLILPPGGAYPIDFYREPVSFPSGSGTTRAYNLTFLKYNIVFAASGLAAKLPLPVNVFLLLTGFSREDWHELDNFVAVHIVLDETGQPLAVILAQHNYHRTYLLGRDLALPPDGRMSFDIALRSNEIYPASDSPEPAAHRVIPWNLYLKYLLSGKNPPFIRGTDLTYGKNAGGRELDYDLVLLSPCDPLYTARILLGEPRPFFGKYIGRDGPPGSDYYNVPELLPMGTLMKFAYLHDGDPDDIKAVSKAIDIKNKKMDIPMLVENGGMRFYRDWKDH